MRRVLPYIVIAGLIHVSAGKTLAVESAIMVGHIINITVLGHAELSQSVLVREDGTTDFPLLANIPIDGMSISELSTLLAPILTRYVERPLFFVNISEYRMLNVRVLGQVRLPGPHVVREPIGLQGILSEAGGTTEHADLRKVTIIRRSESYELQHINVNMYEFFIGQSEISLPNIQNGDLVIVPVLTGQSYVKVMGEVHSPGNYVPMKDESIADVINMAGGPSQGGNLNDVIHIFKKEGKYEYKKIKLYSLIQAGRTSEIPLASPGDIIIIKARPGWKDLTMWSATLRDIAMIVSSIVLLQRI